jgi:hypothetical protein
MNTGKLIENSDVRQGKAPYSDQSQSSLIEPHTSTSRRLSVTNSLLLTLALGAFFNNLFTLRIYSIFLLIFTAIFLGMIYLFDQYKKSLLTYFFILGLCIVFILISYLLKLDYIKGIKSVYQWCLIYNGDEKLYERSCSVAVTAGILLLCSMITYPLHRFRRVKSIAAAILAVLLIISAVNKIDIPKITVGVVIFYSLSVLAEYCGKVFYKSGNTVNNSIATIYLAPACALIAVFAVALPSHSEPIQWKGVKILIQKAQEQGSLLMTQLEYFVDRTGNEFAVNFSGYSEDDSELGGDIKVKNETALKIGTQNKSTARGYLIGSINDVYTGHKWEKSETVKDFDKEDYYYDFYELLTAFTREEEAGGDLTNIIKKRNFDIEYYDIRTRSLFYPLKTYNIKFNKSSNYHETGQGSFLFGKAKGLGTKYEVQYYELNLNNKLFQKMLREGSEPGYTVSEAALNKTAKDIFGYDTSDTAFDIEGLKQDLIRRSGLIKAEYTTLPANLPERVKKLAVELAKGCDNDYDKLKAIEAYLNTLPYTTVVGKPPKDNDFVDYFLFHQQKGYCTYFATAMGVLARCLSIPTRYVEGFVVDYKNQENASTYKVLSSSAHSWVEAYIDGIGWIPFEPTPEFYAGRYTPWRDYTAEVQYPDSGAAIGQPSGVPQSYQNLINNVMEVEDAKNAADRKNYVLPVLAVIASILILFTGIIFTYYYILVRKYDKKFKNAPGNIKLALTLAEILRYLDKEGFRLQAEETLLTYAMRIGDNINFNRTSFLNVANLYMGVRYGENEVEIDDLKLVIDFSRYFRYHLQEKLGKRRMFFDRFLFLHFYQ